MNSNLFHCPVCSGVDYSIKYSVADHFLSGEVFPLQCCSGCGMLITGDVPSGDKISAYYASEDYISHSDNPKGILNSLYHRVRSYMLGKKHHIIRKYSNTSSGNLLDIGAGTGYFLNYMRQRGWNISGTEKSMAARDKARQLWELELLPGEGLFSFDESAFDVITMWHVMEHIDDLEHLWQTLNKILKPGGLLVIALPNSQSADAEKYLSHWAAWDVPRHIWHFNPAQVIRLVKNRGMQFLNMHPMFFDAFYISIMSEKYKQSSFPVLRGFLFGFWASLQASFNKKKSSSLIYIFRKVS